jgi:hypothetical protein
MHEINSNKCVGRSILSENEGTKIKIKTVLRKKEIYETVPILYEPKT